MQYRILIVEDYTATRVLLARLLEEANYHVTQAANGRKALELLDIQQFDIVLTDIVMGEVDGIDVMHYARGKHYNPVVILLTGYGTLETCVTALRAGAFNYLLKPCSNEELLECVNNAIVHQQHRATMQQAVETLHRSLQTIDKVALGTTQTDIPQTLALIHNSHKPSPSSSSSAPPTQHPHAHNPIQVGDISIGHTRQKVSFAGKKVHVTPIEYAILCCLAETPGEPRGYGDIALQSHQIDLDAVQAQELLRPHIRNLRKKFAAAYFVNDYGTGYRLVDPTCDDGDDSDSVAERAIESCDSNTTEHTASGV